MLKPPNIQVVVEGRFVRLRPFLESDITDTYLGWLNNPEINQFLETRYERQTRQSAESYLNALRSQPGCDNFAIYTQREDRFIGTASISKFNPHGQGYTIWGIVIGDAEARQMGYGGEAAILMIHYMFSHPEIHRIQGAANSLNVASCRLMETAGFQLEGRLRQHAINPDKSKSDILMYGLLRPEWERKAKQLSALIQGIQMKPLQEVHR